MDAEHSPADPEPRGEPLAVPTYRALTVLLAALALGGHVTYLLAVAGRAPGVAGIPTGAVRPALLPVMVAGAVLSALAASAGVWMSFRGRADRGALPMGLALSAWAYLLAYAGLLLLLAPPPASALRPWFDVHFLGVEAIGLAGLLSFTTRFPGRLSASDLQAPETLPAGFRALQRLRGALLGSRGPWLAALGATALVLLVNRAMGRPPSDAALLGLTDVFRLLAIGLVVLNLRRGYLVSGAAERARGQWAALGFLLLVGAVGLVVGTNVLSTVTGWTVPMAAWRPVVLDLGVLGLLWGLVMGVLYEGPRRPAAHVRRAALVGGAATLTLLLAAGLEALFAGALPGRLFLPRGLGTGLALLTLAAVYPRLRDPADGALARSWRSAAPPPAEDVHGD